MCYKLTTNVSVIYYRIKQYPVNTIYNIAPKSYLAGLLQVWRHITVSTVLTQEEIPE